MFARREVHPLLGEHFNLVPDLQNPASTPHHTGRAEGTVSMPLSSDALSSRTASLYMSPRSSWQRHSTEVVLPVPGGPARASQPRGETPPAPVMMRFGKLPVFAISCSLSTVAPFPTISFEPPITQNRARSARVGYLDQMRSVLLDPGRVSLQRNHLCEKQQHWPCSSSHHVQILVAGSPCGFIRPLNPKKEN